MSEKLLASTIELRDRLRAFVGAVAEITDCGHDVDAIVRADEAIEAWNRRTPAPEGEAVKSYGQKGRALYEAFWARNGDASPPPWDEQAHAIRAMWVNIARDAEPLYASPVVPKTADEIKAVVMAWLDADDPASWGDFEKRLNAAVSDEASPVVPAPEGEAVAWRVRRPKAEAGFGRPQVFLTDEASDGDLKQWRLNGYEVIPLYASPVVPVGVREAVLKAAQSIHNAAIIYEDEALLEDAEIVIAALRPTERVE